MHGDRLTGPDALRGVAAMAVMVFHFDKGLLPLGMLAVDMFFILSGYILTLLYQDRLRNGLSFGEFAWRRFVRLYPIFFFGVLLSFYMGGFRPLALLMIGDPGHVHFPGNKPLWTLPQEMLISLFFAAWFFRLRSRWLVLIVALGAAYNIALFAGSVPEVRQLQRVFTMFPLGMLFARMQYERKESWLPYLALVGMVGAFALPLEHRLLVSYTALPAVMLVFARYDMPHSRLALWLGAISFPLYAIHVPLLNLTGIWALPLSVVGAWAVARYYDEPVRQALEGWRQRRIARSAAASRAPV